MSINIMNNRRILQVPSLQTYYLCTIQSFLQFIELIYCHFWEMWNTALQDNIGVARGSAGPAMAGSLFYWLNTNPME